MLELIQSYFAQAPEFELNAFWISQLLVLGVVVCNLSAYQFKQRKSILLWSIAASIFLSSHFYLLEQMAAASITGLAVIRKIFAFYKPGPQWLWIFLVLNVVLTLSLFENWYNFLALTAVSLISVSNFQANDKNMRLWQMGGTQFWIIHNLIIFTPVGVLTEVLFLLSNSLGYYRFYLKK